jgi:hypothetical protein
MLPFLSLLGSGCAAPPVGGDSSLRRVRRVDFLG